MPALNRPYRTPGASKKFAVKVRNPSTGRIKTVRFGDPKMSIKSHIPSRKRSFLARHRCATPGPRTSARYWSCRMWK
jgi:hypothetical protein